MQRIILDVGVEPLQSSGRAGDQAHGIALAAADVDLSAWFGMDYTDLDIVATYNLLYNASLMVEEGRRT